MKRFIFHLGLSVVLCRSVLLSQAIERLSLHDAIAIALQNNPQALAAGEAIGVERGRFWRGVSLPPPTLAVNYQYIPRGSAIKQFGERSVEISQSLDFPTTILLRGKQLSSKIAIAEADLSAAALAIRTQVKIAYYDALAKQKKIELTGEILAIAEDFARKAEIRYRVGEATNLERLTAAVQRTQAQNALAAANNDLKISLGELSYALGRNGEGAHGTMLLTDTLVYEPVVQTLDQLLERAGAINPQLHAASQRVTAASYDRALAWSSFLPALSASYYRQTVAGSADFYGVTFGVSLPIWALFDQRGQIQEAAASEGAAEHERQSLANAIAVNVKTAYWEMENHERQMTLHRTEILPQAEELYRTALASYEAGEITYIEYLQARQILISSRTEYIEELARFCTSLAKLEQAVGASLIP